MNKLTESFDSYWNRLFVSGLIPRTRKLTAKKTWDHCQGLINAAADTVDRDWETNDSVNLFIK